MPARSQRGPLRVQEEDNSPAGYPVTIKLTDGSLTDNGDGSFSIELSSIASGIFYLGPATVNGSWRFRVSGNDLLVERRESGVWVEKGSYLAS